MAKQRFHAMHKTRAGSWLRLASWVLAGCAGLAVAGWAGQAAPQAAAQKPSGQAGKANAQPAQAPAKRATAITTPRAQAGPRRAAQPAPTPAKKATAIATPRAQAVPPPAAQPAPAPAKKAMAITTPRAQAGPRRAAQPAPATQAAPAPKEKALPPVTGRRDPFKLPVVATGGGEAGAAAGGPVGSLPPGNRGLLVSQLQLEGIVRLDTTHAMIAVVTDYRKLAYFLKTDDVLYDGVVSKITPDAVYFKENHLDPNGGVMTVEVVKRMSPAPGEGK